MLQIGKPVRGTAARALPSLAGWGGGRTGGTGASVADRVDDCVGPRKEAVAGAMCMQRSFVERASDNSARVVGNVPGDLRDRRGPIHVVGDSPHAQAVEGGSLGATQRPGPSPRALVGAFVGES